MKTLSPLQIERLKYQPKLPACLALGINSLEMVEGEATQSVRDQEQIKNLFKNTYGKPVVTFKNSINEFIIFSLRKIISFSLKSFALSANSINSKFLVPSFFWLRLLI